MFLTGILMAYIRTYDPFYRFLLKQWAYECFGVVILEPQGGIKAEVLSTFLTSSLNIELVYIILTGITRFSGSYEFTQTDLDSFIKSKQGKYILSKFLKKKKYKKAHLGEDGSPYLEEDEIEEVQREIRKSINEHMDEISGQREEMEDKINPFQHIRQMMLNKIKINNAQQWDVAQYDEFVANGMQELNRHQEQTTKKQKQSTKKQRKASKRRSTLHSQNDGETIINEEVKISDFAYTKFQEIRQLDGISDDEIQQSLGPHFNYKAVFKAGESQGKSGSFFFFSHDRKFIIKTMFQEELNIMIQKLPEYFVHLKTHPNSIIARIYGVFQQSWRVLCQ